MDAHVNAIAPRGATGGCQARTQDPTGSSATRGSEDTAWRRQACLECDRICVTAATRRRGGDPARARGDLHCPGVRRPRAPASTAWRGEILAGAVYELIAQRMPEREADILRRMAEAESGHRGRLEARMHELGIEIPDPASVRVPLWLRLQARIAPVDRLLAAREAAEDEEVDDLYKRSTGDEVTDQLLRSIRKEERSRSMAVQEIRLGSARDGSAGAVGAADKMNAATITPSKAKIALGANPNCRPKAGI